jgi:hypothetical protein
MRILGVFVLGVLVCACPSGRGQQADAQTSSSGATQPGTGPLAGLESSPFMNEAWTTEDGQQLGILYYARENLRMTSSCRTGSGELSCDAIRYVRNGQPVEIPHRELDGRTSAGVKVCRKLNQPLVRVHNSVGSEDSYCRFPDGSLLSTATLERYAMRVTEP